MAVFPSITGIMTIKNAFLIRGKIVKKGSHYSRNYTKYTKFRKINILEICF